MRRRYSLFNNIVIFILAQIAWLALLGLWIYWYVSNYIIFEKVGDQISPQIIYDVTNVLPFVVGLVLLVALSLSLVLFFRHLNIQLRLTRLYDNFIANVTHELKSPLASIQLYLETLKSRNVSPEKQKEFYALMMKDADRLKKLVNSILEIAAQEKKKIFRDHQIYNAGDIVEKLLYEAAEQFKLRPDSIHITGKANCSCFIDINAMRIVLDNLVDNAIKYSIKPIKIDVNMECSAKKLMINFSDNGIGIAKEEQKKIFNKFQRIYDEEIPNVKGTGLGLYWVKEIIKNHKGKIFVYSEGKGKGTTFKIELPVYVDKKSNKRNSTKESSLNKIAGEEL